MVRVEKSKEQNCRHVTNDGGLKEIVLELEEKKYEAIAVGLSLTKENWLLLLAMICGISLVFLDGSILPVALPTIKTALCLSENMVHWMVNVFFLMEAAFVILGGRLGDVFGTRKIYLLGLLLFIVASVIGGCALSGMHLLIARALQGLAAAFIAPSMMTLIVAGIAPEQRGKAIGIAVACGSVFLSLGPFIGGVFTQYLSWRFVFFINIFIAVAGLYLTLTHVKKGKQKQGRMDFVTPFFFAGALLCLTLLMMEGRQLGWASKESFALQVSCLLFGVLFFLFSNRKNIDDPFVDFTLFKKPIFTISNIMSFFTQVLLMNTIFWALYMQTSLRFLPATAGFWSLLSTLPMLITAPLAGHLSDRYGWRPPVTIGFGTILLTFLLIVLYSFIGHFALMVLAMILFGGSISMVLTPLSTLVITAVDPKKRGQASGIFYTTRFTGATVGMAVFALIYKGSEGLYSISILSLLIVIICFGLCFYKTAPEKVLHA